jgi:hypothetical protein
LEHVNAKEISSTFVMISFWLPGHLKITIYIFPMHIS